MATNELLPFANGEDANILPTAQWQALTDILQNGFQSGIARSEQVNRVLAQGAIASYVLGQLIVDQLAQDATLDETTLYQNLVLALQENAKDACLPLIGGTVTGNVTGEYGNSFTWGNIRILNDYIIKTTSNGSNNLCSNSGYNNGPSVSVYGPDYPSEYFKNKFFIRAGSGPQKELVGSDDGTLTWDGKKVSVVYSNGHTFIRYDDGTQICWGRIEVQANQSSATQTFPAAFAYDDYAITISTLDDNVTAYPFNIGTRGTSSFTAWCPNTSQFGRAATWIAIGRWW